MTTLEDIVRARNVPVRSLVALRAVESGGNPRAVRFEPHLFKARRPSAVLTLARPPRYPTPEQALALSRERLAARQAGLVPYTPGYDHDGHPRAASSSSFETDREALDFAVKIDPSDAVLSTSFGSTQALGAAFQAILPQHRILASDGDALSALAAFDHDPVSVSLALLGEWLLDNPKACEAMRRGDDRETISRYNGCKLEHDLAGHVCGDGGCAGYLTRYRKALAAFDAGAQRS